MAAELPRTGDVCQAKGLYESACDQGHFKFYKRGQPFEICHRCGLAVDWIPVNERALQALNGAK